MYVACCLPFCLCYLSVCLSKIENSQKIKKAMEIVFLKNKKVILFYWIKLDLEECLILFANNMKIQMVSFPPFSFHVIFVYTWSAKRVVSVSLSILAKAALVGAKMVTGAMESMVSLKIISYDQPKAAISKKEICENFLEKYASDMYFVFLFHTSKLWLLHLVGTYKNQ